MIVAERILRNKIPETLNSGCLCARSGDPRRAAFLGAQRWDCGWSFPPCSARDPYAATLRQYNQQTEDEVCRNRSIEIVVSYQPKAAKQSHDYRIALPELVLDSPARQRFIHRMVGDASSLRKSQIRRHL
jgi:hypothetical protein